MTLFRALVIGLSLALAPNAVPQGTNPAQGKPPAVSINIHAEHDTVKAGASIILIATLTNLSEDEITVWCDSRGSYLVDVSYEGGKSPPDKRVGYRNGRVDWERLSQLSPEQAMKSGLLTFSGAWVTLKPGKTLNDTIDVAKTYDMTQPGIYKIIVERPPVEGAIPVKSNHVTVTVTK
jgi:hypothetical protein